MFYFSSLELVHDLCHEVNFFKSNNKGPQLIKFNAVIKHKDIFKH